MEQPKTVELRRLVEFNNAGRNYIAANQDERSMVTFAINKLLKHYEKQLLRLQKDWQEELNEGTEDIRVEFCEKDKDTGAFKEKTYGEGANLTIRKVFTAANERLADKKIKDLNKSLDEKWYAKEVEVTKVYIVLVPPSMDILFVEAFKDFIFEPMTEEQLEEHYLAQGNKKELVPQNGVN